MGTKIEIAVYFSFFSSLSYIVGFTLLAPWWRNPVSRGMVSFSFATLLLLFPAFLHYTFGWNTQNQFFLWYYICSLFLAGFIEWWRLRVVYRIQQEDTPRRRRKK